MAAFQSITDGLSLMAGILKAVSDLQDSQPSWDSGPSIAKRLQEMKKDLVYLGSELGHNRNEIKQLQLMVRTSFIMRNRQLVILSPVLLLIIQADTRPSQTKARSPFLHSDIGSSLVYSIYVCFCM